MWKLLLPLLLVVAAVPAGAQQARPDVPAAGGRPVLHAAPVAGPIRVDGRFDEPAWAAAEPATGFTQAYPSPGAPASQRTEVRILAGPDALYVAARMHDTQPDSIAAQLARRDVLDTYSDRILLFLDSHNDRRTAFHFGVNPRGVKQDGYQFDDRREDPSWDAVWDVATTVDSLGWTAEFRIPLAQLRFSDRVEGERVWGLGIMREIARHEERSTWSPWTRNDPGFVSTFGELRGLQGMRAPRRLEILPYTSASLERSPGDPKDPFYRNNAVGGSVGADVRYGLPGGLTLTATLNPDFGQVEVDPAVVNLSAFETFFPERRPFFVEGSDIFRFGEVRASNLYGFSQFFYSRRIGRPPQRGLFGSGYAYVDTPDQSTILGAAKVSGKTAGGWSVGIMNAVTAREEARFLTPQGEQGTAPVEPLSNYFVGRVRRDLNRGNTVLGGIVTATHRDLDSVFDPLLRSSAYVVGVDGQHSWKGRAWTLSGFLAASHLRGSSDVIAATQRSSARYFRRPDAEHLGYDPTRTALGGHIGSIALAHRGSWDASAVYQQTSPGFEINDLGFIGNTDRRSLATALGRRIDRPGKVFRNYSLFGYTTHAWNFGGDNIYADLGTSVSGTFRNFWSAGVGVGYKPEYMSDRLTRGGPLARLPATWRVSVNGASDRRSRVSAGWNLSYQEDEGGQFSRAARASLNLRPSSTLQVSVGPSFERERSTSQFVLARADSLATGTYGGRYVFADVEQSTLSLPTRVDWTFTPTLSLQLFAQPFVSTGDFESYKEFTTPGGYDFAVYGRDRGTITRSGEAWVVDPDGEGPAGTFTVGSRRGQRDFTFRSLRGNAVLRWEYRPGSTVFLVWQQLRSGESALGSFDLGRDTGGMWREPARNIFLVKATYWLGR